MLLSFVLSGCGGGSSPSEKKQEKLLVGLVTDSYISGLRYISTSPNGEIKKGITNSKGEYEYFKNGTTKFYVGKIPLANTESKDIVFMTTVAKTQKEQENIARFLQTIDSDSNPDNGIQISATLDQNAKRYDTLSFSDDFDEKFEKIKKNLFKHSANIPETVSVKKALAHSSKSERLSSLQEYDLYKVLANSKKYNSSYYNTDVLEKDQRKRVYLWIWEKLLAKEMNIEDDVIFGNPKYNLENIEEAHDEFKKYIDYAEVVSSLASIGKDTHKIISTAGSRTFGFNIARLTTLSVDNCEASVKIDGLTEQKDNSICKSMMKVLNPFDKSSVYSNTVSSTLSSVLPKVIPDLVKWQKMHWLKPNIKTLKSFSKIKMGVPYSYIATSIAGILNDIWATSSVSNSAEKINTRMIAREWLSIWYRSGFKPNYMNKLINNNTKKLVGRDAQIKALAVKLGSTGALCEAYRLITGTLDECSNTAENINYNHNEVLNTTYEKMVKAGALYKNIMEFVGPVSNEKGEIGTVEINWDFNTEEETCKDDNYNCPICKENEVLKYKDDGSGYCELKSILDTKAPVFMSNPIFEIEENKTDTISVRASDDSGKVIYSLDGVDKGYFNLDESTGKINFKIAPKYDDKHSYSIVIIAKDKAGNIARQSITVKISKKDTIKPKNCHDDNYGCPVCKSDELLKYNLDGSGYCARALIESFIYETFDNSVEKGLPHGITYENSPNGKAASFSRESESRIVYPFKNDFPREGTIELMINVKNAYHYNRGSLKDNQNCALVFTTDIQGGDVTQIGSSWLYLCKNGDIKFHIAGEKYEKGWDAKYGLLAKNTSFRFNQWNKIAVSYGSKGRYIKLNGHIVASNLNQKEILSGGGKHSQKELDQPTLGESVSHFWSNNQYEGGFEGLIDEFRVSKKQKDFYISN